MEYGHVWMFEYITVLEPVDVVELIFFETCVFVCRMTSGQRRKAELDILTY